MHHTASNSDSHINKNSLKCLYDSEKELPPDCENRLHAQSYSLPLPGQNKNHESHSGAEMVVLISNKADQTVP